MTWFKPGAWGVVASVKKLGALKVGEGEANRDVADVCASQLLKLVAK